MFSNCFHNLVLLFSFPMANYPTPTSANWRNFLLGPPMLMHVPQNASGHGGVSDVAAVKLSTIAHRGASSNPQSRPPPANHESTLVGIWAQGNADHLFGAIDQAVRVNSTGPRAMKHILDGAHGETMVSGKMVTGEDLAGPEWGVQQVQEVVMNSESFEKVFNAGLYLPPQFGGRRNINVMASLPTKWKDLVRSTTKKQALLFYFRTLMQRYPVQKVEKMELEEERGGGGSDSFLDDVDAFLELGAASSTPARRRVQDEEEEEGEDPVQMWLDMNQNYLPRGFRMNFVDRRALKGRFLSGGAEAFNRYIEDQLDMGHYRGMGPPVLDRGEYDYDESPMVAWVPLTGIGASAYYIEDEEEREEREQIMRIPTRGAAETVSGGELMQFFVPFHGFQNAAIQNRFVCKLTNPENMLFSLIPTKRPHIAGFWQGLAWSNQTPVEGVRVNHDTRLIRRRILSGVVYNPGAAEDQPTGLLWDDLAEMVYERVRADGLFTPNDKTKNYYASMAFYFEGVPGSATSGGTGEKWSDMLDALREVNEVAADRSKEVDFQSGDVGDFLSQPVRVWWCPERPVGEKYNARKKYSFFTNYARQRILEVLTSWGAGTLRRLRKYRLFIEIQWIDGKIKDRRDPLSLTGNLQFSQFVEAGRRRGGRTTTTAPAPARSTAVAAPSHSYNTRSRAHAFLRAGAYVANSLQEKMFVTGSMLQRFSEEQSMFYSPHRDKNTCVIMSLFRAERTIYQFRGKTLSSISKGPHQWEWSDHEMLIPVIDEERWKAYETLPPFVRTVAGEMVLRLSYSQKHEQPAHARNNGPYLPGAATPLEIEQWELASEEMIAAIEFVLNRPVDINQLSDVCQAFADAMHVVVAVYDIEYRGERIDVYPPEKWTPEQLIERDGKVSIVHLIYDQGHCHSVAHHQSFISGKNRKICQKPYQYCPFCDKSATMELNTFESAKAHITKCAKNRKLFDTQQAGVLKKNFSTSSEVVKKSYKRHGQKRMQCYECCSCHAEVEQDSFLFHVCTLQQKERAPLHDESLFVYDMESSQVAVSGSIQEHVCNCVCVRKVYGKSEEDEWRFQNEVEFMEAMRNPEYPFKGGTFIAHNGGGYDSLFLLRVLERWNVAHQAVPSPSSDHKFISIQWIDMEITFLDSMRFIPGSLRSIAESFGCALAKGDFPHRFNDGKSIDYKGPIPPQDEHDYWCQKTARSEKQAKEWEEWFKGECEKYCTCWGKETCECEKPAWDMRQTLFDYCMLDVRVLAEIVQLYREEAIGVEIGGPPEDCAIDWRPPVIDPFTYMTLPQITVNMFALGFQNSDDLPVTLHQWKRGGQCPQAILWMEQLMRDTPGLHITHRGNHHREYYCFRAECAVDGYCAETDTAYVFLECEYWACKYCYQKEHAENAWCLHRQMSCIEVERHFEVLMMRLTESFRRVEVIWEHDFYELYGDSLSKSPYDIQVSHLLDYTDCFYGGRTEVFALYADAEKMGKQIKYYDVCSLYPSTYLKTLPTGVPDHLLGAMVERERLDATRPDAYFGFVRCEVFPNREDKIGLLPVRDKESGRLTFPVHAQMVGVWHTEELYLAMEHGYRIGELYEAYIWEEPARSDQHIRGYVSYFLRMKQEAEGWKKLGATSDSPSEEEKARIVEELYEANGRVGRIRPEYVSVNPVKRQKSKLNLNAFWGKFGQKITTSQQATVYGPAQFAELWSCPFVHKESFRFRETSPGVFKVHYNIDEEFASPVGHGNVFFAATVTAHARCVLHRKILEIGADNVLYCDTDSVIFLDDPVAPMAAGVGLGQWTDEYPGKVIRRFAALAPKMYMLDIEHSEKHKVRAKGVQLSLRNQDKLQIECIRSLLEKVGKGDTPADPIQLENMVISTNSRDVRFEYGTMLTRTGEKQARVVISKRVVVPDPDFSFEHSGIIRTLPLQDSFEPIE